MVPLITDPAFYWVAVPAVALVGLSKGGFGGPMALVGVPLLALVISPVQAAAILLPILLVSDAIALWGWRGQASWQTLKSLLPGGLFGIALGWMLAAQVTADHVRLIVGVISILFVIRMATMALMKASTVRGENAAAGAFWGALAGFTSFVAHAGAPPYQVYALRLGHSPAVYAATNTVFFAITNVIKLVPYFALGQFDASNLATSAVLAPVALVMTAAGIWLTRRVSPKLFYPMMHVIVALIGCKLIVDGVSAL
ncbi:MAG: sulfite exporter TauE/SafE family protein [Rhizobiaceae bacterium]|jgi:hypothetical protein|nr:sulfite exporter TauE/SafE family protein [Rhizobiaceae bacterium]